MEKAITPQVLKESVGDMQKDLPKVEYTAEKSAYFHKLFDATMKDGDNRLTKVFGSGEKNETRNLAASVLAKRFHIDWMSTDGKEDKTKPARIVDMTTLTVYKPDSAE